MDLSGKTVLILGGSGLVGQAVARRILSRGPGTLVLVALFEEEVQRGADALDGERGSTALVSAWGDIFMPARVAQLPRGTMLHDPALRELVLGDLLGDLSAEVLERSFLYQLFERFRPDAVVDCINTATAFAYQDVFHSSRALVDLARTDALTREDVERHVLSVPMPQLIRHVQILLEGVRLAGTEAYVKIGTSGTGGMGLNIPYTHSEERPSRTLLAKAAVAGGHSLLLFLLGRTPNAPSTVEIKPTAAIAWREIAFGPVRRRGELIAAHDCPRPLPVAEAFAEGAGGWVDRGQPLEAVYADVGENGYFAREEFETVTALGQMEFITPEEVAEYVLMELEGRPTGRDIVAALDSSTAGPTYRAGILRSAAIERLAALEASHGVPSIAFEMLGPPRLSKHLYEAFLLSAIRDSLSALAESEPAELAEEMAALVARDGGVRSMIVSVGLPIVVSDEEVYRGPVIMAPPDGDLNRSASRGWVDLRPANCSVWVERARKVVAQAAARRPASGSNSEWGAVEPADPIRPSRMATWIFRHEEGGERIKR